MYQANRLRNDTQDLSGIDTPTICVLTMSRLISAAHSNRVCKLYVASEDDFSPTQYRLFAPSIGYFAGRSVHDAGAKVQVASPNPTKMSFSSLKND